MTSPQYNYGAIGGINYMDSLTNQYLQAAMMSPNVNFKANNGTQVQAAESVQSAANDGAIPVVESAGVQQASAGGSNFVTGVMAAALIGGGALWMLKSGKFPQAGKALKSLTGNSNGEVSTVLKKLTAIKNGSGELKVLVPNKTTTFAGNKILPGVNLYGVSSSVNAERRMFNPQISAVHSFQVTTPADNYTVFVKDGKITKVVSALMKKDENVLQRMVNAEANSTDAEALARFKKIAEELGKDAKEVDKSVFNGVKNIRFSNKYGDDTLRLSMSKYGENPKLRSFTTLEQFDRTSSVVKSYIPSSSEEVFAGELVNKTGGWFTTKGVLADGLKVLKCEKDIAGAKCYFEGGNLVKIEQGKVVYPSASIGFKDFVKANEKAIEGFKKDVFTDRIADKIPNGAIIGTV